MEEDFEKETAKPKPTVQPAAQTKPTLLARKKTESDYDDEVDDFEKSKPKVTQAGNAIFKA